MMKTSNKIFLAAALLIFVYLVGFDFTLKAEYEKGTYKSRFYGMQQIKLQNFNNIDHKAANMVGLRIEQGSTYGVWVHNYFKDEVTISQSGQTLTINYTGKDVRQWYKTGIIITCPVISEVTAAPFIMPKNFEEEDEFFMQGRVEIAGFKQTLPLSIRSDRSIDVKMVKNDLAEFNATLGNTNADKAQLSVEHSNHIQVAHINLKGKAKLNLINPIIIKPNYQFEDSTEVTLSGSALKLLKP
jgi:hypothetical protein